MQPPPKKRTFTRWLIAAGLATAICVLWLLYLNRDGCWFYFIGPTRAVIFVVPWIWLLLFFAVRWKAKIALIVVALLGAILMPTVDAWPASAAQSNAVGQLRSLKYEVEAAKTAEGYPERFPIQQPTGRWAFYHYEYRPLRSTSGKIDHFVIEATPVDWGCGIDQSFTIDDRGIVHKTGEQRPATVKDPEIG